jgi:hypothetical protein
VNEQDESLSYRTPRVFHKPRTKCLQLANRRHYPPTQKIVPPGSNFLLSKPSGRSGMRESDHRQASKRRLWISGTSIRERRRVGGWWDPMARHLGGRQFNCDISDRSPCRPPMPAQSPSGARPYISPAGAARSLRNAPTAPTGPSSGFRPSRRVRNLLPTPWRGCPAPPRKPVTGSRHRVWRKTHPEAS